MNHVSLLGRLTKDPEVKKTQSGTSVCSFTIAVDRRFKNADGTRQTDFIPCVGWRQVADIIGQYFHKGSRIGITGSIQTRSYDGQNGKVFVTEVLVEEIEFIDKRSETQEQNQTPAPQAEAITPNEEEYIEESLPFDVAGY
jgi:single-strand DNA-binding protein